jgi:hypothetical protein
MTKQTAIYVTTSGDNGALCFQGLTHEAEWVDEEHTHATCGDLKEGVHLAVDLGGTAVTLVDTNLYEGYVSAFGKAPGCEVTGWEHSDT